LIRTPTVKQVIETESHQALLLEWIKTGNRTASFWKTFGTQLAQLHSCTQEQFGFDINNYMGSVPQRNTFTRDWSSFFIEHRLVPLVDQCLDKKLLQTKHKQQFENLYAKLPLIMAPEPPSLLHGDLWSGNYMCDDKDQPVLIDPAPYFGHRSMDLAMSTLFGGFDPLFYQSYQYHFPFPYNYKEQWDVCNLYPLLIHLLLFGETYLSSIETTLTEFQ
jgi:fructosamine-3-kinase